MLYQAIAEQIEDIWIAYHVVLGKLT